MENEKIDWKTKNTYQKLVYVSAEISKQGIRPTGVGAHASKYYDMKDFVPTAMRLGGEVGLAFIYDFKVEDGRLRNYMWLMRTIPMTKLLLRNARQWFRRVQIQVC